jgi:hypothetical protein
MEKKKAAQGVKWAMSQKFTCKIAAREDNRRLEYKTGIAVLNQVIK